MNYDHDSKVSDDVAVPGGFTGAGAGISGNPRVHASDLGFDIPVGGYPPEERLSTEQERELHLLRTAADTLAAVEGRSSDSALAARRAVTAYIDALPTDALRHRAYGEDMQGQPICVDVDDEGYVIDSS